MQKRKIKAQEGERLDDEHIERVIKHLENKGTKKEAYGILNIKDNPSRLARIIEDYHEKRATAEKLRKANRGKPATPGEIHTIVQAALDGDSLTGIAEDLYRPLSFVKSVIDEVGIPQKGTGSWYERRYETSIPDKCMSDQFREGEIVWSDKYNGLAIVVENKDPVHIYVIEKVEVEPEFSINGVVYTGYGGRHAWQKSYELGSLEHLKEHGIDIYKPYRSSFPKWLK